MSVDSMIAMRGITCSTQRPVASADTQGALINTYVPNLPVLTVYVQQGGGSEADMMGAQRNTLTATGYTYAGTDVLPQDRLFAGTVYWDIQEVRTLDERSVPDGTAHIRLSLSRTLPL